MEAIREDMDLLDKILPPRLEDAGLEDCALPPDSIQEAFRRAADAVKSRAAPFFEGDEEDRCVADPWPGTKETETDAVVGSGLTPSPGAPDSIVVGGEKSGTTGFCIGGELAEEGECGNAVVVGDGEGGRSCGDGLKGLGVEGMNENGGKKGQREEEEGEKPILVEGFV
ncbi:PREDICTED: uncharacterized protein LOC104800426 [Tarenaya hassleriana]|uniref:uncharacterized protein LOC104800426 n=1 Tax=Tarenaya hassleriana TaxID=28532 RepID=UPI00053C1808|nr:PREDICTED: uncharacterized protein LOC104800426 [Tarenaya hassleriana]